MANKLVTCLCGALALVALFAIAAGREQTGQAAFPGYNGDIAFSSDRVAPDPQQVFRVSNSGGEADQLTFPPGENYMPAWSPDGTKIAFVSTRDGPGRDEIYVMNADGSEQTPIAPNVDADDPAWSAEASTIAFSRRTDGGQDTEIWTAPSSGGTPALLIDSTGSDAAPAFSPDGTRIAYQHGEPGESDNEIYVADLNDLENPMRVTDNDTGDSVPDWSPDSNRLVYQCRLANNNDEVCVIDADGGGAERLTPGSIDYFDPVWSPDGTRIAFNDFVSNSALYSMKTDGTDLQPISANNDYWPSWQPLSEPPPQQVAWGDHNCSGSPDPVDGLLNLRHDAGLPTDTGDCPEMGAEVDVDSTSRIWGDFDCSSLVDPIDALKVLRHDAGLSVERPSECPVPGQAVTVR